VPTAAVGPLGSYKGQKHEHMALLIQRGDVLIWSQLGVGGPTLEAPENVEELTLHVPQGTHHPPYCLTSVNRL
jgi:hypothetical protein